MPGLLNLKCQLHTQAVIFQIIDAVHGTVLASVLSGIPL